jgi:hypothetical protein
MSIHYGRTIAACLSAIVFSLVVSACTSISSDDEESAGAPSNNEHTKEITQSLTGLHKMCSGFVPGIFRDTIVVTSWHPYTCAGWVQSIGGTYWQLGCLTDYGYSWGAVNGGIPNSNCGWSY